MPRLSSTNGAPSKKLSINTSLDGHNDLKEKRSGAGGSPSPFNIGRSPLTAGSGTGTTPSDVKGSGASGKTSSPVQTRLVWTPDQVTEPKTLTKQVKWVANAEQR